MSRGDNPSTSSKLLYPHAQRFGTNLSVADQASRSTAIGAAVT